MFKSIYSPDSPLPGGTYSPGIVIGDLLFLSGQGPFDILGTRVGETFADQVRKTFQNLESLAEVAGTNLGNTIRYGVYLRSFDNFAEFNEIALDYLSKPFPARTTIEVALRGFDLLIDAVVAIPKRT